MDIEALQVPNFKVDPFILKSFQEVTLTKLKELQEDVAWYIWIQNNIML